MIRRPPRSTLFPYTSSSDLLLAQEGLGVVGAHYRIPDESGWVARVWYGEQESEKQGNISYVPAGDRKSTRLNSSHGYISYAVFCLKKKKKHTALFLVTLRFR